MVSLAAGTNHVFTPSSGVAFTVTLATVPFQLAVTVEVPAVSESTSTVASPLLLVEVSLDSVPGPLVIWKSMFSPDGMVS